MDELRSRQELEGCEPQSSAAPRKRDIVFRLAGRALGQVPPTIPTIPPDTASTDTDTEAEAGALLRGVGVPFEALTHTPPSSCTKSNPFDSEGDGTDSSDDDGNSSPLGASSTWKSVASPPGLAHGSVSAPALKYTGSPETQSPSLSAVRALATVQLLAGSVSHQELALKLPCKAELVAGDLEAAAGGGGADTAVQQLRKDYARDRIIIQSHRLEGSKHSLEQLVLLMKHSINAALAQNRRLPLGTGVEEDAQNSLFCMEVLASIARTQSAFLTHMKLNELCLQDPENPIAIVPESELADPIKLRFSVKQRHSDSPLGTGDFCVLVEMEAGTVFRFNNAMDDDLTTLLQLRCTFCRSLFGMPATEVATGGGGVILSCKSGKAWVLLQKEMTTTRRDWV